MSSPDSASLSYPCRFPIKAFLRPVGDAEARLREAVSRAIGVEVDISRQPSSQGNYIALTFDFVAESEEHVARVRAILRDDPAVLMSL